MPIGSKQPNSLWFHDLDIANTSIGITLEFTENETLEIFRRDSKAKYSQTREGSDI